MKEKQKIKQTMHFRRPSAGLPAPGAGVPAPPLPPSAAGGAASGDAGERPAVAEGRSWILPLAKTTPDVTNSSMLASTPYRSRFLQMEFYKSIFKELYVCNK